MVIILIKHIINYKCFSAITKNIAGKKFISPASRNPLHIDDLNDKQHTVNRTKLYDIDTVTSCKHTLSYNSVWISEAFEAFWLIIFIHHGGKLSECNLAPLLSGDNPRIETLVFHLMWKYSVKNCIDHFNPMSH